MDRHNTRASSNVHEWSQTLYHWVPCTIFTVPVVEEVPTNTTWLFTTKVTLQWVVTYAVITVYEVLRAADFTWTRHASITWVITVHSTCHVCWARQKTDLWPVTIDSRHGDTSCSPSEKRWLVSSSGHVSKQHDFVKIKEIVTCL